MINIKKLLFLLSILVLFEVNDAKADSFVINLYFDQKTSVLTFDKQKNEDVIRDKNMEVSIVQFSKSQETGPYILKLYDVTGAEFSSTEFNKSDGSFQLIIPYFSVASKLSILEKKTNKEILSKDLTGFVTCNGNGKCEAELGETFDSCMADCLSNPRTDQTFYLGDGSGDDIPKADDAPAIEVKKSLWQRIIDFFKNLFSFI